MDYRIVSIGTLSHHDLWPNQQPPRTPHATTTLIQSGDQTILVDPALPPQIIQARLQERSGLTTQDITHVFLTNFQPAHRWGLPGLTDAQWLISEMELEFVTQKIRERLDHEQDPQLRDALAAETAVLERCRPAPDRLAEQVDLFPLPGFTPGTCGLLLSHTNATTLLAGDAVPTVEHLQQGRVLRTSYDVQQARESLAEAVEIADVIIPGHDNLTLNRTRRRMW